MLENGPTPQFSLYRSLQNDVVAAARDLGITARLEAPFARTAIADGMHDENTPQMIFEDVINALIDLELFQRDELNKGGALVASAVLITQQSIELLRSEHHLEPLTKLEQVEESLKQHAHERNIALFPDSNAHERKIGLFPGPNLPKLPDG